MFIRALGEPTLCASSSRALWDAAGCRDQVFFFAACFRTETWEGAPKFVRGPAGMTDTGQLCFLQHTSQIPTLKSKQTEVSARRTESSYNILPLITRISNESVADKTLIHYSESQETSARCGSSHGQGGKRLEGASA